MSLGFVLSFALAATPAPAAAPAPAAKPLPKPVVVDRILATVDTHAITRHAVVQRMARLMVGGAAGDPKAVQKQAITELIDETLITDDATSRLIEISDDEVKKALDAVADQNQITLEALQAEVKKQGMTWDEYQRSLRRQLLELRWLGVRAATEGRPSTDSEGFADFMVKERARLLEALKAKAVIEVRE